MSDAQTIEQAASLFIGPYERLNLPTFSIQSACMIAVLSIYVYLLSILSMSGKL